MSRILAFLDVFRREQRAASAIEFAFILPVMLVIVLGGYEVSEAVSAYRKTTMTAQTVANLATQYTAMGSNDFSNVLNASAKVMAPFDATSLTIVLTEFQVDAAGIATVTWSRALNTTALAQGSIAVLPVSICLPNASIVLSQVSYTFTPGVLYNRLGPFTMSSSIYMSPRSVKSIPYTGS